MKKILCLLVLVAFIAVAYAGDAPFRWKNPPASGWYSDTTGVTSGTFTDFTSSAVLSYNDTSDLTWSHVPNVVQMAPAAVRFESGVVICPHCRNEFKPKDGGHTIILEGTKGEYETCIDTLIEILDELGALRLVTPKE